MPSQVLAKPAIYVAFLRGINAAVTVKMATLRAVFESLKLIDVKTVAATGNVIFRSPAGVPTGIEAAIEQALFESLRYRSTAIVLTKAELMQLSQAHPFKSVQVAPTAVGQVTFTKKTVRANEKLGLVGEGKGYRVISRFDSAVCSVVDLSGATTPDLLQILDKVFDKKCTTRSWNTVSKVIEVLKAEYPN